MRNRISKIAVVAAAAALMFTGMASAQQKAVPFDGKKFFEEIENRGGKMPASFDANKFFEDIANRGGQSKEPFDGKKFFEEIENRGGKMPAGFDGNKFFEDIANRGGQLPPGTAIKK